MKYLKKIMILKFLVFLSNICFSQEQIIEKKYNNDLYLSIHIIGFFDCDTISLLIDDQYVFLNQIYTSLQSEFDYTYSIIGINFKKENNDILVSLVPLGKDFKKVDSLIYIDSLKIINNVIKINTSKNTLITIIINGLSIKVSANLLNEKYFYFQQIEPNNILIWQNTFVGFD